MNASGTSIVIAGLLLAPGIASGIPFDDDGNGVIDLADYVALEACLTGPAAEIAEPECGVFDDDRDTHVDLFDFGGFQRAFGEVGPTGIVRAELAGNSLDDYPYFEYVKAFNENATVEVALDPNRYPDIVGRTADIYVVEARTPVAWTADPTLADATPDGPETATFGGITIQDNTVHVVDPYDLDSAVFDPATNDFTGLGHGYDVVVDMNRNGRLDAGDYIDGLGNEAGLYVVHDTTARGPLDVTHVPPYNVGAIFGIPSYYANEVMYYPTDIDEMEPLPLILVGHGGGHNYQWYDHIGYHMASYGYIVVSHQNCYGPPDCTLGHTDAVLDLQDAIADGAIDGKVDADRIIWIGHSLGGKGVVNAFDTILDGEYIPTHYSADSIVLISAMLPNGGGEPDEATPHHANFHLWTAAGDTDISGSPWFDQFQTFPLHDRATAYRMSTVVQGTGHAWFHDGPGDPAFFTGPCSIGRENTHRIQLGLFLPLIKHFAEGNVPAADFFWRQYERFRPIGVDMSDLCIVVSHEYRNGSEEGNFFIDDYQSGPELDVSSSGGAVTYTVEHVLEGRLDDNNDDFSWTSSDPFNGATHAFYGDTSRGVVFDWNGEDRYYEWEVIPDQRNFANYLYLSFRGAQGTQHPYTLAVMGDLTLAVALRDGAGHTSSINIGAYGGGLEQPYDRSGGWHDDFERIRIRVTDFLTNGSGLDLSDIAAVRLNVGPSWGSPEGRIVVDEMMLTNDYPSRFVPLTMRLPSAPPEFIPPHEPTTIDLTIREGSDTLLPETALLHYRYDDGAFQVAPLELVDGEIFHGTLPPPTCSDRPEYYFSAEGTVTGPVYQPMGAPGMTFSSTVGDQVFALDDDFETDQGWTVESIDLTDGEWERGLPGGDGSGGDPAQDYDGSGQCYLTANRPDRSDVDGGPTRLVSPTLDLRGLSNPVLRYARWWSNDDQDGDPFDVEVSNDNGESWVLVERVVNIPPGWVVRDVHLTDYVTLTDQMQVRFSCMDNPNDSVDEGGVDAVSIFDVACE